MQQGDYIDGGSGDDCIVVEGDVSAVTVKGGSGNDRTIVVPADTSESTIQNIFAHCYDKDWLSAMAGPAPEAPAAPASPPVGATTAPAPPLPPQPHKSIDLSIDSGAVAALCATMIGIAWLTSRFAR